MHTSNCVSNRCKAILKLPVLLAVMLVVLLVSLSAQAASKQPWADSLRTAAASEVPSLQYYLDSLGYDIDVATEELGWETLTSDSGVMTVRLILEIGNSASSALFGYFPPSDHENQTTLFYGFNEPGDSTTVVFDEPKTIGFFMTPYLPSINETWYTWQDYNEDGYDHAWVFRTGEPNTYLIAFEDLPENGDSDFQDLVIEVTLPWQNHPPAFQHPLYGPVTLMEGQTVTETFLASDPDGTIPSLSIGPEVPNVEFVDRHDGTGVFTFSPDFDQAGNYQFELSAYDGQEYGTAVLVVAVANVNRPPYFDPEPPTTDSVTAGETFQLLITAADDDGTVPSLLTKTLPPNAVFTDNGDGTGELVFVPDRYQMGNVYFTFIASDGAAADTARVTVKVLADSQAPIIEPIEDVSMAEADLLLVGIVAYNPGNTQPYPSIEVPDLPSFATLGAEWYGHRTLRLQPGYQDAGDYDITVLAYNATDTSTLTFHLTVANINAQPFVFADGGATIYETDTLVFEVESFDGDGTTPYLTAYLSSADTLATNMTFIDLRNGFGRFTFIPSLSQGGPASNPKAYYLVFRATDEEFPDVYAVSTTVTIEVIDRPAYPVLDPIGNKYVNEGELLEFSITYHDPTLQGARLFADPLPEHAVFTDYENGHALFSFRPDYFQSGMYYTTFRLKVGEAVADSEVVSINVVNVNRPPFIFTEASSLTINEGDLAQIRVDAYDADSTIPALYVVMEGGGHELAPNMEFVDSLNGVGVFTFAPDYSQGGPEDDPTVYYLEFYALDAEDTQISTTAPTVTIYVTDVNPPPVLEEIGSRQVVVGETLQFDVSATDPADGVLSLYTTELPGGAEFTDHGDGHGQFVYTPEAAEMGDHIVTFYATDGESTVSEDVTISVLRPNTAPTFSGLAESAEAIESTPFSLIVHAVDDESDAVQLSVTGAPEGAVFTDRGDGAGQLLYTPDYSAVGQSFELVFQAVDWHDTTQQTVHLSVINQPLQVGQTGDDADVLVDGAIRLTFNELIDEATMAAGVLYTTKRGSVLRLRHVADVDHSVVYIEPVDGFTFQPLDTLRVTVNQSIHDLAGYPLAQAFNATYLTGALVYPGDTNNDGFVDERDILPIGTYFGRVGPSRPTPGYDWGPSAAYVHGATSAWAAYKAVYADADGSGTIDADDICAVSSNWGMTRQVLGAPADTRDDQAATIAALGDERVVEQLAAALADCAESAGKDILLDQLTAQSGPEDILPTDFALYQNYPNPFNAGTVINFDLPQAERVTLDVYNMVGQRVITLVDQTMPGGSHRVHWEGRDQTGSEVASGVYFYRITTGSETVSKRMLLLK